jgi:hypothetical protein
MLVSWCFDWLLFVAVPAAAQCSMAQWASGRMSGCGVAALVTAVAGVSRLACRICLRVVASSLCCSAYAYLACKVSYSSGTFRRHGVPGGCHVVEVPYALLLLVESCDLRLAFWCCVWAVCGYLSIAAHVVSSCVCDVSENKAQPLAMAVCWLTEYVTAVAPGVPFQVQLSLPFVLCSQLQKKRWPPEYQSRTLLQQRCQP